MNVLPFISIMSTTSTTLYLSATTCTNHTGRPPIWMMRQAGRYMPQYRAIREKYDFLQMIRTPELATEITLQPITHFHFDAAILFSDILVTAEAIGAPVQFIEKKGPVFDHPIRSLQDIDALTTTATCEKLSYVTDAIKLLRPRLDSLNVPLIGFAGAPFTVAAYMIEGQSSPDLKLMKTLMFSEPHIAHALLEKLTTVTIDYLNAQIDAGVHALQLFDTWASHLSWADYQIFSLHYISKIVAGLKKSVPLTIFCKGSGVFAPLITQLPIQVLGLDWNCDLSYIRQHVGPKFALQGNLDPYWMLGEPAQLLATVEKLLVSMHGDPGFIFNLGHGIMPDIPMDNVRRVVDFVQAYA